MNRLLPFIFILLAIVLFFGYIRPTWNGSIAQAKSDIDSYDAALTAASNFSANEAALEQQRDAIPGDQLNRLNAFLPDSVDNVQLILDLNALAIRSGILLSNFTMATQPNIPLPTGDVTDESQGTNVSGSNSLVDYLTLSVAATGTYGGFRAFLAGAEQSLRPLDIVNINVSDSDTGVYTYAVTFKFYWLH